MDDAPSRLERAKRFASEVRASGSYRWVGVYDVTPGEAMLLAYSGAAAPAYPRFSTSAGLTAAAISTAQPIVCNDVTRDPRYLTAFASTGSELIVPIVDERGRVVGTLDVESDRRDAFAEDDVQRLNALVQTLAPLFTEIAIRTASPDDAEAFAALYAPYVLNTIISFEEVPPSAVEMRERVRRTLEWTPWLAACSGTEIVGYAYASRHRERAAYRWAVDTSVYLAERFHGRGVGRSLYAMLLHILERQGFRRACAGISLPNDTSVGFHRALGFEPVGTYRRIAWKFGAWHDTLWLDRSIGREDATPTEPVPFSAYDEKP